LGIIEAGAACAQGRLGDASWGPRHSPADRPGQGQSIYSSLR